MQPALQKIKYNLTNRNYKLFAAIASEKVTVS